MTPRLFLLLATTLGACADLCVNGLSPAHAGNGEEVDIEALSRAAVDEADARVGTPTGGQQGVAASERPEASGGGVEEAAEGSAATYRLRYGETLSDFALWSGVEIDVIAEASGLERDGCLPVGTQVRIPVDDEKIPAIARSRDEHQRARVARFLESRNGAISVDLYTVRPGDTAWEIAEDRCGMPIWMLEAYNPDVPLETLHPGQDLMVPLFADALADAP